MLGGWRRSARNRSGEPLENLETMKYGDLTYPEIRELAERDAIAVVPTGCTEQQGLHLPVDFDTWFAETLCHAATSLAEAQDRVLAVFLPAIPFGPTPEHRSFGSGYVDLPQDLHSRVIEAVLVSLAEQRFRRILIWRGCGQHIVDRAVQRFLARRDRETSVFVPEMPYKRVWDRLGDPEASGGGHADAFATSIALFLRPDAVRTEQLRRPDSTEPNWADPNLDLANHTDTGSIGDPTPANAELGKRLWEEVVAETAQIILDFDVRTRFRVDSNDSSP